MLLVRADDDLHRPAQVVGGGQAARSRRQALGQQGARALGVEHHALVRVVLVRGLDEGLHPLHRALRVLHAAVEEPQPALEPAPQRADGHGGDDRAPRDEGGAVEQRGVDDEVTPTSVVAEEDDRLLRVVQHQLRLLGRAPTRAHHGEDVLRDQAMGDSEAQRHDGQVRGAGRLHVGEVGEEEGRAEPRALAAVHDDAAVCAAGVLLRFAALLRAWRWRHRLLLRLRRRRLLRLGLCHCCSCVGGRCARRGQGCLESENT
mmetsp:Transcript_97644/g.273208  ORF Transcript_97644/g.273208 Transcript_97644/m.273208 type:complete len:260 (+) Transcript_97644:370-1149(+)